MKPVYFPYTYANETTLKAFHACFESMSILQPSRLGEALPEPRWIDTGFVHLNVPVECDTVVLSRKLAEYRNWLDSHQGGQVDLFKMTNDWVPFFNESSVAQIKADIREKQKTEPENPLFRARLFLQMAQEFDRHNDELDREIAHLAKAEQDLFELMQGETSERNNTAGPSNDRRVADYMLQERLNAWCRLYLDSPIDANPDEPTAFITTSRDLITVLQESGTVEKGLHVKALPPAGNATRERRIQRKQLHDLLDQLCHAKWDGRSVENIYISGSENLNTGFDLIFYLVPDVSPRDYFARFTGQKELLRQSESLRQDGMNTLIGLLRLY